MYRDGSSRRNFVLFWISTFYLYFNISFILVLVIFLVKETGHGNFILFLFVNTLLFILINSRETYEWHHRTFFTFGDDDRTTTYWISHHTTSSKVVVKNYFKYVVDWVRQGVQFRGHPPGDVQHFKTKYVRKTLGRVMKHLNLERYIKKGNPGRNIVLLNKTGKLLRKIKIKWKILLY